MENLTRKPVDLTQAVVYHYKYNKFTNQISLRTLKGWGERKIIAEAYSNY